MMQAVTDPLPAAGFGESTVQQPQLPERSGRGTVRPVVMNGGSCLATGLGYGCCVTSEVGEKKGENEEEVYFHAIFWW